MEQQDEIVKIPKANTRLGSCPDCGKPMWKSDYHKFSQFGPLYRCIQCKAIMLKDAIIPF